MTETLEEPQTGTEDTPLEEPEAPEPDEDEEAGEAEEADQPEPEPEDPQSPNDMQLERTVRSAEKKWANYARGIVQLYQDTDAQLFDCPLCPTQHKGFVDVRFAGMVPEELAESVNAYLMGGAEPDYNPAPNVARCSACAGYGKVKSGSRIAGKTSITCPTCKGYGYTPPPIPGENGYATLSELPTAGHEGEGPLVAEEKDIWGSPAKLPDGQENPNYGKMPQYKDPSLP